MARGGEFAVRLIDPVDEKTVSNRLAKNMQARNSMEKRSNELPMSIGVVRYDPEYHYSIEKLMSKADNLMNKCKQQKKQGTR